MKYTAMLALLSSYMPLPLVPLFCVRPFFLFSSLRAVQMVCTDKFIYMYIYIYIYYIYVYKYIYMYLLNPRIPTRLKPSMEK